MIELPPILEVIRGISQSEWDRNRRVIMLNMPHDRGARRDPFDFTFIIPLDYSSMYPITFHSNGRIYIDDAFDQALRERSALENLGELAHLNITNQFISNEPE